MEFPRGFFLKNTIFFVNHSLEMAGNFVALPFSKKKIGMLSSKAVLSFSYYKTLSVCIVRPGFEPSTYMKEQVSHVPFSLRTVCGYFNVPRIKCCEKEPTASSLFPRTVRRCHYKGNALSSVI